MWVDVSIAPNLLKRDFLFQEDFFQVPAQWLLLKGAPGEAG